MGGGEFFGVGNECLAGWLVVDGGPVGVCDGSVWCGEAGDSVFPCLAGGSVDLEGDGFGVAVFAVDLGGDYLVAADLCGGGDGGGEEEGEDGFHWFICFGVFFVFC